MRLTYAESIRPISVMTAAGPAVFQQPRDARVGAEAGVADEARQVLPQPRASLGLERPLGGVDVVVVFERAITLANFDGVAAEPAAVRIFSDPPADNCRTSVSSSVNSKVPE